MFHSLVVFQYSIFSRLLLVGEYNGRNRYSQLFLVADNLMALVHPASQRNFSVTVGMNLLLRQNEEDYNRDYNRNGKILLTCLFFVNTNNQKVYTKLNPFCFLV